KDINKGGWEALEGGWSSGFTTLEGGKCSKDKEIMCFTTRPVETFEVVNDLVIDRGPSPYVSLLELFGALPVPTLWAYVYHSEGDERHMTTVQANGLCVATHGLHCLFSRLLTVRLTSRSLILTLFSV
ncbi:hypothetical protein P692DRAFT_20906531, partial [Suillus brevipes Sb2]